MLTLTHWIVDYNHPKRYQIHHPQGNHVFTFLLFRQPVSIFYQGIMTQVPGNTAIFYEKNAPQLYYSCEADYHHDGIFFDGEDILPLLLSLKLPINAPFPIQNPKAVTAAIQEIAGEALLQETYSAQIVDLKLHALFYKLADLLLHRESYAHSYYIQFQQIRSDIYRYPERRWLAGELCGELHLSLSRFQHLYKSFFGNTLVQDIIQSRTEHAQYLLRNTYGTIAAVAEACGYNNEEHFFRQFKKQTGLSPGDYRRGQTH